MKRINRKLVASELRKAAKILVGEDIPSVEEEAPLPPADLPDAEDDKETKERASVGNGMMQIMKTIE